MTSQRGVASADASLFPIENPKCSCGTVLLTINLQVLLVKKPEGTERGNVAQWVECLPSMNEALGSTPALYKSSVVGYTCNSSTEIKDGGPSGRMYWLAQFGFIFAKGNRLAELLSLGSCDSLCDMIIVFNITFSLL